METKKFKPFDKVIVKLIDSNWEVDFYSHYDEEVKKHKCVGNGWVSDDRILYYEGNEHLVGTTDEQEEEVRLEEGEFIICFDSFPAGFENFIDYRVRQFLYVTCGYQFYTCDTRAWQYAIRFSDFNPNDMEETRKHILVVKNGKIVRDR